MTNYIPKYQFAAISAKRHKAQNTFKYQQQLKSGKWGAVREGSDQYHSGKTPQEIIEYWEKVNPDKKFRLVEA